MKPFIIGVAGGDGTTHRRGAGIDVTSGRAGFLRQVGNLKGDRTYHPVPGLHAVDGCFVPDENVLLPAGRGPAPA